ncbi:MAG: transposase, partial [Nitrospirota bacterium]
MRPFEKYPILTQLLKPLRKSQRTTLGLIVAATIEASAARSMEIATLLSEWLDVRFDSALNRFYRLLRNCRVADHLLTQQLLAALSGKLGKTLLIAIDWTEWRDPLRMLVASVLTDRRAIPVHTGAYDKRKIRRSQNSQENTFLRLLKMVLQKAGLNAIILCDRGFRRASWLKLLLELRLHFVIRLMSDVHVHLPKKRRSRSLARQGLRPGGVVDLGAVALRKDGVVQVRVVGVWMPGAKEPWWLATDLTCEVQKLVAYYDRRMAIEEQLRDTKGCRFGLKLEWTQFKNPAHLARFALVVGIAILVWTAAGIAAAKER